MSVRWFDRFTYFTYSFLICKIKQMNHCPGINVNWFFLALRKKLEVTLDYIKYIGRKIQSFINFNISFKFVKVEIRSCCKAERPFIRLRFIPQQTHWWRRQEKLQSCEDGPMISGVLKPNLLQLPIHIHSRLHSYIFVDSINRFLIV